MQTRTVVLEVFGVHWASSKSVVESTLRRQPGVVAVEANPVAQTVNVSYDPNVTSQAVLRTWIVGCGYHCAGQSVPHHICDPAFDEVSTAIHSHAVDAAASHAEDGAHDNASGKIDHAAGETGAHAVHAGPPTPARSSQDVMGHGGSHVGMSMASMIRDMRNRFIVAADLSVAITGRADRAPDRQGHGPQDASKPGVGHRSQRHRPSASTPPARSDALVRPLPAG